MANQPELNGIVACPRCDRTPLERTESGFACAGCNVEYPDFAGMPWLFAEPRAAFEEWRGRWSFAVRGLQQSLSQIEQSLTVPSLRDSTRARLEHIRAATLDHIERLRVLLEPLQTHQMTADFATYLALRTRLPSDQGIFSYYSNVHRDWAWGEQENELSLDIVRKAIGDRRTTSTLVLGAGAGRLAYDLHANLQTDLTVALDFNPFLSLVGNTVSSGRALELYEFPLAPKSLSDQAVLRTLQAPAATRDGLAFVVADTHRPPFARESFDIVITPWLIDIVPEDLEVFSQRVNALLVAGGTWINFGSLNFQLGDLTTHYSVEECADIAKANGFADPAITERSIPYMCSPASRHGRQEEIVCWSAEKHSDIKKLPRYEALPDWIVRGTSAIPVSESGRTQAMSTRIHAYILSLIDGKRTLQDVAKALAARNVMPYEEAQSAIRTFLIRMYEQQQRGG